MYREKNDKNIHHNRSVVLCHSDPLLQLHYTCKLLFVRCVERKKSVFGQFWRGQCQYANRLFNIPSEVESLVCVLFEKGSVPSFLRNKQQWRSNNKRNEDCDKSAAIVFSAPDRQNCICSLGASVVKKNEKLA